MLTFLDSPTRNLFFTGKGGVGKTSVACATAVWLADAGKRVLLVSTDPASNLDEVLQTKLGNHPTPVALVPNLFAMNLDPEAAAAEYREVTEEFAQRTAVIAWQHELPVGRAGLQRVLGTFQAEPRTP